MIRLLGVILAVLVSRWATPTVPEYISLPILLMLVFWIGEWRTTDSGRARRLAFEAVGFAIVGVSIYWWG